jgi:homoserine O-succinyltransferase
LLGAQAGLYHNYGIKKHTLSKKLFGVFKHKILIPNHNLLRGFDDEFFVPHSRYTDIYEDDVRAAGLDVLAISEDAGVYIAADHDCRNFYITGHCEYDPSTLAEDI